MTTIPARHTPPEPVAGLRDRVRFSHLGEDRDGFVTGHMACRGQHLYDLLDAHTREIWVNAPEAAIVAVVERAAWGVTHTPAHEESRRERA